MLLAAWFAGAAHAQSAAEQARARLARAEVPIAAMSLVQYAAQGEVRTVGSLLATGLAPSAREPLRKTTALHSAAALGQLQMVDLLLSHQAEVNAQDWRGLTPLINAVHGGQSRRHSPGLASSLTCSSSTR
ncbi:ankyrin repeat domain-containing protein [Kinneretia asaccharophila]|uniref:ankyrin repeat domain-containing protein n=1 Tax=Roseateles asaccharophilus TaxID=582607 RepID=UPI0013C3738D|nr:ankyrin repeat domain-containing protein [Roseateles asaccharophilus]MDN3542993.1 ankyrin repeat domain-containing protein [Roseateles asaccharophilus]